MKKVTKSSKATQKQSTTKKAKTEKKNITNSTPEIELQTKMNLLQKAYLAALSGEIKFGEVKSMFKKLHKEIKSEKK